MIMTSSVNHEETYGFFKSNNFFGGNESSFVFFSQSSLPAVDSDGKIIMKALGVLKSINKRSISVKSKQSNKEGAGRPEGYNEEKCSSVCAMYKAGKKLSEIEEELDVVKSTIYIYLAKKNIPLRSKK